jgi:hypothetical protein
VRGLTDREALARFMSALGKAATADAAVYFTGGVTAVLFGWRDSTIDIDLELVPDHDELLRAIATLKDELRINVELAAPSHFIPELPGWETRSPFITREGRLSFYHYDLYSQALAKIERGHAQDRLDVMAMRDAGLVQPERLRELFAAIEPEMYRYPAIDARSFRAAVDALTQ